MTTQTNNGSDNRKRYIISFVTETPVTSAGITFLACNDLEAMEKAKELKAIAREKTLVCLYEYGVEGDDAIWSNK